MLTRPARRPPVPPWSARSPHLPAGEILAVPAREARVTAPEGTGIMPRYRPSYDSEEADNGGRERGARSRNHSNRPPPFNASHHVPSHCIPLHPITSRRCNLRVCDAVGRVQSWPFAHLHHISYSGPVGHGLHLRICLNKPNQTACLLSWILRTPSTTCGWRPSNSWDAPTPPPKRPSVTCNCHHRQSHLLEIPRTYRPSPSLNSQPCSDSVLRSLFSYMTIARVLRHRL